MTRIRLHGPAALALALGVLALPAVPAAAAPSPRQFDRLERLLPRRDRVRVTAGGERFEMRRPQVSEEGLRPGAGSGAEGPGLVRWEQIERVQVRSGSAAAGAVIGGATGAFLMLGLGLALSSDTFFDVEGSEIATATFGGAVFGALGGALVGAAIPRWRTVWRDSP